MILKCTSNTRLVEMRRVELRSKEFHPTLSTYIVNI